MYDTSKVVANKYRLLEGFENFRKNFFSCNVAAGLLQQEICTANEGGNRDESLGGEYQH